MDNQDNLFKENPILYGLAFDNKDNHKRITTGENFYIAGGSAETHENLVKKVWEFSETIKKYGKKMDDLSESEFYTIAKEISSESEKTYWFFQI